MVFYICFDMKVVLLCILLLPMTLAHAQETADNRDYKGIYSVGVGLFDYFIPLYAGGMSMSMEYYVNFGKRSALAIGGYTGIKERGSCCSSPDSPSSRSYRLLLAPRFGYVFVLNTRIDIYAALMHGYVLDIGYGGEPHTMTTISGGMRLRLMRNLYGYAELGGYNWLIFNGGVSVKF
jgi:hypothetical protein